MNKKEVIAQLEALRDKGCEIAEVILDISGTGEVTACYPKESFLVYLVSEPSNDDLIIRSKHYTICSSIRDFNIGAVFGESAARRTYSKYFVSKVHSVNEFKTDFYMTKEEFLNKESDNFNKMLELKSEAQKLEGQYKKELMELNGYKVGDVLTYEINGRTEKGMVYSVDRMCGDDSFYLHFKKVKKDGTMSLVDNDVMSFRKEFKLKQL